MTEDFASALEFIRLAPSGQKVLDSLRPLSETLLEKFGEHLQGPIPKTALALFGREKAIEIIYANCVLFASRLLSRAREYDSLPPKDRAAPIIALLSAAAARAEPWAVHLESALRPIHDKKERTKRRHLVTREEQTHALHAAVSLVDALWKWLLSIVAPNGAASLSLPRGGTFLISFIDEQLKSPSFVPSSPEQKEETLRILKTSLLYWLFSEVQRQLDNNVFETPHYDVPADLVAAVEPLLAPLRTAFLPADLPSADSPSAIASVVVQFLFLFIHSFSLEASLTTAWLSLSASPALHAERELETLIESLSHDDRPVRTILNLIAPKIELGPPGAKNLTASFWGLLIQGLTSTVSSFLLEDALSSFDWEGTQRTVLDRLRWFFLSPYADEAIVLWTSQSS